MAVRKQENTPGIAPGDSAQIAAAIRALRDAIAGLGTQSLSYGGTENAATILVRLGARLEDAQQLHEYLAAHPGD